MVPGQRVEPHGIWQLRGSDDDSTYVDIGTWLTLDGILFFEARTHTEPAGNTRGYRYYKLAQLSGTTSASPSEAEIEFKINHQETFYRLTEPGAVRITEDSASRTYHS